MTHHEPIYSALSRNGSPSSITQYASPIIYQNNMHANVGTFVQDQWTFKRMTLTGGLRHDYFTLDAAPESLPEGIFVPAREFKKTSLVQWKDFNPRLGFSYDVFGDGTVVLKSTPGHTPGHQSLFVKLARTGALVLTGDLYHYAAERALKTFRAEDNIEETRASRAAIDELLQRTGAQLWIQHDILKNVTLKKSPQYYD